MFTVSADTNGNGDITRPSLKASSLSASITSTMDDQLLLDHIHDLTDLELAILLSLVANEHCLIETDDQTQDDLAAELGLVSQALMMQHLVLSDY